MKTCSAKFQLQNLLNSSNSFLCYILVLWMHQPALLYVLSSSFCSYPQEFQDKGKSRAFFFIYFIPPPFHPTVLYFCPVTGSGWNQQKMLWLGARRGRGDWLPLLRTAGKSCPLAEFSLTHRSQLGPFSIIKHIRECLLRKRLV